MVERSGGFQGGDGVVYDGMRMGGRVRGYDDATVGSVVWGAGRGQGWAGGALRRSWRKGRVLRKEIVRPLAWRGQGGRGCGSLGRSGRRRQQLAKIWSRDGR